MWWVTEERGVIPFEYSNQETFLWVSEKSEKAQKVKGVGTGEQE